MSAAALRQQRHRRREREGKIPLAIEVDSGAAMAVHQWLAPPQLLNRPARQPVDARLASLGSGGHRHLRPRDHVLGRSNSTS